jgi:hypothetical protein
VGGMSDNPTWTKDRVVQLRSLVESGTTYERVAKIMKVTKNSVAGAAKRNGIRAVPENAAKTAHLNGGRGPREWTEHEITAIRENAQIGLSHYLIAKNLGLDYMGVRRITEKLNIPVAPGKSGPALNQSRRTAPAPIYMPQPMGPAVTCQYVLGKEGRQTLFCDEPSLHGCSWCETHALRVYERAPSLQQVAAE